jgi:uncharacterized protein (DUF4415 family)
MKKEATSQKARTDWRRLKAMEDDDIDLSDVPEVRLEQFAKRVVRQGLQVQPPKQQITLRIDSDVLDWFKTQGRGYQTQINALLRAYMDAHKK